MTLHFCLSWILQHVAVRAKAAVINAAEAPDGWTSPLAPCDALILGRQKLGAFSALSAAGLVSSAATAGDHGGIAEHCADADVGNVAVGIQVKVGALNKLRQSCRRDRACRRRLESMLGRRTSAWFAACVPVSCLGHDRALYAFALRLLWSRLLPNCGTPDRSPPAAAVEATRLLRLFGNARPPRVAETLLAEESTTRAGWDGPFDVVTVTDSPLHAEALRASLPWPLRLRFLQPPPDPVGGPAWRFRWFDVERHLLSYVAYLRRRGLGDRLVVYADGFDTAWLGCRRNLTRALDALGRPLFFGVEFGLFPAGERGYPLPVASYMAAAEARGRLPRCRKVQTYPSERWAEEPVNEHEPCLALSDGEDYQAALYLNGGVYGGRAKHLEVALQRVLAQQQALSSFDEDGKPYRVSGRTHQYLWSQYYLDRPDEVALDYGGAFVVNLAPRSLSPRQFGLDKNSGMLHSVVFQRTVCLAHSNGGGYADHTLQLLRAAVMLRFDTTAFVGMPQDMFDHVALHGLYADVARQDRVVVDTSLCFDGLGTVAAWRGVLTTVQLLTSVNDATLQGLQFMVVRPHTRAKKSSHAVFDIVGVQHEPIFKGGVGRMPNSTGLFSGRLNLNIASFNLKVQQGDCIGWRCRSRCDFTYKALSDIELRGGNGGPDLDAIRSRGTWVAAGHDIDAGTTVALHDWFPQSYVLGADAEVYGIGFYKAIDGG